jgi:hypothetical protein
MRSLARDCLLSAETSRRVKHVASTLLSFLQAQDDPEDAERCWIKGGLGLDASDRAIDISGSTDEYTFTESMLGEWRFPDDTMLEDAERRLDMAAALSVLRACDDADAASSHVIHCLASIVEGGSLAAFRRKSLLCHGHDFGFGLMMMPDAQLSATLDGEHTHESVHESSRPSVCALELILAQHTADVHSKHASAIALVRLMHAFLEDTSFACDAEHRLWRGLGPLQSSHMFCLSLMRRQLASDTGVWRLLVEAIEGFPNDVYIVVKACKSMAILCEGRQDEVQPLSQAEFGLGDRAALLRRRITAAADAGAARAVIRALAHDEIRRNHTVCGNAIHMIFQFVGKHVLNPQGVDYGGALPSGSDGAFLASMAQIASAPSTFSTIAQLLQACPFEDDRTDPSESVHATFGWLQVSAASVLLWLLTAPCFEWSATSRDKAREAGLHTRIISISTAYHYGTDQRCTGGMKTYLLPERLLRLCLSAFVDSETTASTLLSMGAQASWLDGAKEIGAASGLALLREVLDGK